MKNKILLVIFLSCSLFLSGCSNGKKTFILMKSTPLTAENARYFEQSFQKGQRVYFAVIKPDGFKDDAVKIEIIKKSDTVPTYGYSMEYAQDIAIDNSKNYFTNYFVPNNSGLFFMQVFELRRPDKCLARYDFRVK